MWPLQVEFLPPRKPLYLLPTFYVIVVICIRIVNPIRQGYNFCCQLSNILKELKRRRLSVYPDIYLFCPWCSRLPSGIICFPSDGFPLAVLLQQVSKKLFWFPFSYNVFILPPFLKDIVTGRRSVFSGGLGLVGEGGNPSKVLTPSNDHHWPNHNNWEMEYSDSI